MEVVWTRSMDDLEMWLKSWSPSGKRVLLLLGPVGSGKTTALRAVAGKLGYRVVTVEDVDRAFEVARSSPFLKVILHLDRPYELGFTGRRLRDLVEKSRHPVVIEDEPQMQRYYDHLLPAVVYVRPPKARIARLVPSNALVKPRFSDTNDMRQLLNAAIGADVYREETWEQKALEYLRTGRAEQLEQNHIPALLDTFVSNCYGLECIEAMSLLVAADYSGRPDVLEGFRLHRRVGRLNTYFYDRLRASKG